MSLVTGHNLPQLNGRRALAAAVALAITLSSLAAAAPVRAAGGDGLRDAANAYRSSGGLNPVSGTALLDDIATARAAQMVSLGRLEHNYDYVRDRLNQAGACWTGFGEIIAWERGYAEYSYTRTLGLWWNSAPHHAILMTPDYNAAGGAWARSADGSHYSVMIFVTLCSAPAGSAPDLLQIATRYDPARRLVFVAGNHTGYRLTESGEVLATKSARLSRASGASVAGRSVVNGQAYYYVVTGIWQGYWVRETSRSYLLGTAWVVEYDPARRLAFAAGTTTGYKYDANGRVIASKSHRLYRASGAPTARLALINGVPHFYVTSGVWSGYWVPDTALVWLL